MDTEALGADDRRSVGMSQRERPRWAASWSRRGLLRALAAFAAVAGSTATSGPVRAAAEERVVYVPSVAFGAIVAAIAGGDVTLVVDPSLPAHEMRLHDVAVSIAERILLKGQGEARGRYLDDARNAPKLGAAVRDALRTRWPELGDAAARRHKAWSRMLVRNVLRWTQALDRAGLRGKRISDPEGRIYLLEWAGAEVAADGAPPPAGLHGAPREPASPSPEAYDDYVQALVDALE